MEEASLESRFKTLPSSNNSFTLHSSSLFSSVCSSIDSNYQNTNQAAPEETIPVRVSQKDVPTIEIDLTKQIVLSSNIDLRSFDDYTRVPEKVIKHLASNPKTRYIAEELMNKSKNNRPDFSIDRCGELIIIPERHQTPKRAPYNTYKLK